MRIRSLLANTFLFHIEDLRAINLFYIVQYNFFFIKSFLFKNACMSICVACIFMSMFCSLYLNTCWRKNMDCCTGINGGMDLRGGLDASGRKGKVIISKSIAFFLSSMLIYIYTAFFILKYNKIIFYYYFLNFIFDINISKLSKNIKK